MGLNYEKMNGNINKPKSDNEKAMLFSKDFPNCNDLYPDCPEQPSLLDNKCRSCPKTEGVDKPKLEWVDCEFCSEDGVPIAEGIKKEDIGDTKCHVCGKINSKEYIVDKRS